MTRFALLMAVAFAAACEWSPKATPRDLRVVAARSFTEQYAHSRLAPLKLRASAAGRDCDVLLVDSSVVMEDSMIEALHYGGGAYSIVDDTGVQGFYRKSSFRGVVYKDSTGRVWTYDAVTPDEIATLKRCD